MAAKKESNTHIIKINGQLTRAHSAMSSITEKQRRALKKKNKKKLKSIGKRHPEFELTYDMMLGIRYAVSLSEPSVTTTTTRTRTVTATHTVTTTKSSHTLHKKGGAHTCHRDKNLSIYAQYGASASSNSHSHSHSHSHSTHESMDSSAFDDISSDDTDSDESDDERLIESEFLETKKYKFPSSGSETTPAHQMSDFKFKDYCPQIFRQLREWFRISTQEYLVTICGDFKLLEFISNSKSGQFFFFSHNSQFIIKTMTRTESIFLRKILPSYYTYVSQQPDTLLPKFYGMHRVKRKKQKIYFLIQQNVFYSDVDDIHDQYDLKGSTQGRRATKAERKKGAILKDLDWVDEEKKIKIGAQRAKLFKDQLKRDTHWLRREKIMDYSLLVGIHYLDRARSKRIDTAHSPQHQMLVDHSTNNHHNLNHNNDGYEEEEEEDEEEQKYETRLKPVEESKEEILCNLHTLQEEEEEDEEDEEELNDAEMNGNYNNNEQKLMIEASTTEHTGDDEDGVDFGAVISPNDDDDECTTRQRRHSADNATHRVTAHATRRNSAPTVPTPRELMDVDSGNRYKFTMDSIEDAASAATAHIPQHCNGKQPQNGRQHLKSQSLQLNGVHRNNNNYNDWLNINNLIGIATNNKKHSKPSLRAFNSERPSSTSNGLYSGDGGLNLKVRSGSTSTHKLMSNEHNKTYRGHISVKHPKRYKRKTAAEMQFAVDDIHIPVGIKHEVGIADSIVITKHASIAQQNELLEETKSDLNVNNITEDELQLEHKADIMIDGGDRDNMNLNIDSIELETTVSGDICPWTTYHGGMILETEDARGNCKPNEVYFIGLIDILQKYNKRKKLENWIKKMKYDKHAISAAPPDLYAQRMCDFFDDKVV